MAIYNVTFNVSGLYTVNGVEADNEEQARISSRDYLDGDDVFGDLNDIHYEDIKVESVLPEFELYSKGSIIPAECYLFSMTGGVDEDTEIVLSSYDVADYLNSVDPSCPKVAILPLTELKRCIEEIGGLFALVRFEDELFLAQMH